MKVAVVEAASSTDDARVWWNLFFDEYMMMMMMMITLHGHKAPLMTRPNCLNCLSFLRRV